MKNNLKKKKYLYVGDSEYLSYFNFKSQDVTNILEQIIFP